MMNLKKPVAFVLSLVLAAGMTAAVYGQGKKGAAKSAKTAPKAAADQVAQWVMSVSNGSLP